MYVCVCVCVYVCMYVALSSRPPATGGLTCRRRSGADRWIRGMNSFESNHVYVVYIYIERERECEK